MISIVHTPVGAIAPEDPPIAMGDRNLLPDWQAVADACEAASRQFEWGADFRICPERRLVEAVVPADRTDRVARTTLDFYAAVARHIGIEAFMALEVDFDIAP
jgi:hypothetical protein